jgi:hypothetical protein
MVQYKIIFKIGQMAFFLSVSGDKLVEGVVDNETAK